MIGCRILSSGTIGARAKQAILSEGDVQGIVTQFCEVLADVIRAVLQTSVHFQVRIVNNTSLSMLKMCYQPLPNAFELFGADLLVTHNPSLG